MARYASMSLKYRNVMASRLCNSVPYAVIHRQIAASFDETRKTLEFITQQREQRMEIRCKKPSESPSQSNTE